MNRLLTRALPSVTALVLVASLATTGCQSDECEWGETAAWDTDESGLLEQTEFYEGFNTSGAFSRWDVDADGSLDANEFETVFGEIGDFDDWDQNDDDALRENEVYSGLYNTWNEDADTGIGCEEFDQEWAGRYGITGAEA